MIRPDQLFNAPIPGQSLVEDPSASKPWEMPPKFSTVGPALDHLFNTVTSKKFMQAFNTIFKEDKKFFVDKIAVQMLQEGFLNGMWTVDLMLLLVEPLICLLVWLASTMDLTVSFSTDTGAEDRTGFEDILDALSGEGLVQFDVNAQTMMDNAEGTDVTTVDEQPMTPAAQQPAAVPPEQMRSPLVGGTM